MTFIGSSDTEMLEKVTQAWEAVRLAKHHEREFTAIGRAISGNPKLRVEFAPVQAPCTTGPDQIYLRPPMAFADKTPHVRHLCGHRGENGLQQCAACEIHEDLIVDITHEIAHQVFGTFEPLSERDAQEATDKILSEAGTNRAKLILEKLAQEPPKTIPELNNFVSPYMPFLWNCLEDARVNRRQLEVRPGLRKMYAANFRKLFEQGVPDNFGGIHFWRDAKPNQQLAIGLFLRASGFGRQGWLSDDIEDILDEPEIQMLLRRLATARSVKAVYRECFPILEACRRRGFFKRVDDIDEPEPEPQPGQGEPCEDGEPGKTEDSQPGDGERDQSEPNKDSTPTEGPVDPEGDSQQESAGDGEFDQSENDGEDGDGSAESEEEAGDGVDQGSGGSGDLETGSEQDSDDATGAPGENTDADDDDAEENDVDSGSGDDHRNDPTTGDKGDPTGDPSEADGDPTGGAGSGWLDDYHSVPDSGGMPEDDDDDDDDEADDGADLDSLLESGDSAVDGEPDDSEVDGLDDDPGDSDDRDSDGSDDDNDDDMGSPEEVEDALGRTSGHGKLQTNPIYDKPDPTAPYGQDLVDQEERELIDAALNQGDYMDRPSIHIAEVNIIDKNSSTERAEEINTKFDRRWTGELIHIPEQFMAPAHQRMRRAFAENRKHKYERNLKSGKPDIRTLSKRVPVGDPRIFEKRRTPGKRDWSVLIGLDISGSTAGGTVKFIREAGYAQADLCARLGINFAVFAHSGGPYRDLYSMNSQFIMDIHVIKDWNESWSKPQREALSKVAGYGYNLDGHTMEYYRKSLLRQRTTNHVLMYYTDGAMPQANFEEERDILELETGRMTAMPNVTLMGVGIGTDSPVQWGLDTVILEGPEDIPAVVRHLEERIEKEMVQR